MGDDSRRRRVGSVRELPNGRWLARITCGVRADGSPRTLTKTHDTERQANAWLLARSVELSSRPDLVAGITLRKLWEAYKADREDVLANKTMSLYRWYMEGGSRHDARESRHVTWLDVMGDVDVSEITPAMVQRHVSTMPREKGKHAKTVMSAVISWAVRAGMLKSNPLVGHRFEYAAKVERDDFDVDPFAAIEGVRDVWGPTECLECFERIRGLPLEPAWLACVGAGLRVEESLALRGMDVRRAEVGGRMLTQLAVHAARTDMDERKSTKTRQSVRVVSMMEPFGVRYWDLAQNVARDKLVCAVSASNQNKRWRGYFAEPSTSKHAPKKEGCNNLGRLHGLRYIPLSKMRNTHVTLLQMAGVPDSLNALVHGHTEQVERRHYMRPDTSAVTSGERFLRLAM